MVKTSAATLPIEQQIDDLGVKVIETDEELPDVGCYIPLLNVIVLDAHLDEMTRKRVLLHELAHARHHRKMQCVYNTYRGRLCAENEANSDMLVGLVEQYFDQYDLEPEQVNSLDFLRAYELDESMLPQVERAIRAYFATKNIEK